MTDVPARRALAERMSAAPARWRSAAGTSRAYARAGIVVPAGALGDLELAQELQGLVRFAVELAPALDKPTLDPVSATLRFRARRASVAPHLGSATCGEAPRRHATTTRAPTITSTAGIATCSSMRCAARSPADLLHSRDGRYVLPPVPDARAAADALSALSRRVCIVRCTSSPVGVERTSSIESLGRAAAVVEHQRSPLCEDRDPAYGSRCAAWTSLWTTNSSLARRPCSSRCSRSSDDEVKAAR